MEPINEVMDMETDQQIDDKMEMDMDTFMKKRKEYLEEIKKINELEDTEMAPSPILRTQRQFGQPFEIGTIYTRFDEDFLILQNNRNRLLYDFRNKNDNLNNIYKNITMVKKQCKYLLKCPPFLRKESIITREEETIYIDALNLINNSLKHLKSIIEDIKDRMDI